MSGEDGGKPADKEILSNIVEQAQDLCRIHDHSTRVIANLDIGEEWFSDYDDPNRAKFGLKPVVLTFLYMYLNDFNQSEVSRHLSSSAYIWLRFDLKQPLSQQLISHISRNRFTLKERQLLREAADQIQKICYEHNVRDVGEPALDPEDIQDVDVGETQIKEAVERATEYGLGEFTADRASNAKYALEAYLERQGYLNVADAGTTTPRRRFARLSNRNEVPHGSSHNRTMKKIADPTAQLTFDEFETGKRAPFWKRVRDEVLEPFHVGVDKILDDIIERDGSGIQEPVNVAIDITTWDFWPSPFKSEDEVDMEEEPIIYNGRERYLKEEYPKMVSGYKDAKKRGYHFATLTIVAQNTPIVLAIEPVRNNRGWEQGDVETTSRGILVDRLLEQAQQHVEINKVYCDREFDSHEVRDVIDQRGLFYVIGKSKQARADERNVKEIIEHPVADIRVERASVTYEGRTHDLSFMYVPKDNRTDAVDPIDADYAIFTINAAVSPDRAMGICSQYRDRWMIENEYKTIKKHFLPTSASSDYRIRFLYFTIGVIMYNIWRLANFILRDEVNVDLGEKPPLRAGEIIELVAFCLFDPGG